MNLKHSFDFNFFVFFLLVILVGFMIAKPCKVHEYYKYVDWKTIFTLSSLLLITTAIKESHYFDELGRRILNRFSSERSLATFLILFSAGLSTFLTNDITLFIVVPLTLSIQNLVKNDLKKLIILEAFAVNIGSSLTPIGNPQNLFLWYQWKIPFFHFVYKLLPLVTFLLLSLLFLNYLVFSNKKLEFLEKSSTKILYDKKLLSFSLLLLLMCVIFLELHLELYFFPVVFLFYLFFYRKAYLKADWLLIFMFILIFIDFHLISALPPIIHLVHKLSLNTSKKVYLLSFISSQIISNVPASVFVSKFSHDWFAITYGVNVAGNGIIISSLANLIAIRLADSKVTITEFHKFAVPFCFVTFLIVYLFI